MNSLNIYIKQRVNWWLWATVTLMLIVLSMQELKVNKFLFLCSPFVMLFLLIMRLFDDLASAEVDKEKDNRVYAQPDNKRELKRILVATYLILLGTMALFDQKRALFVLSFFVVNQLLYLTFFNVAKCRYFLPLLKYSFIIFLLNLEFSYTVLTVYFAFLVFEMLEDDTFPGYLLSTEKISKGIKKYLPYLFLLLFLVTHLIYHHV